MGVERGGFPRRSAHRSSTYPSVPCTRMRCPSRMKPGSVLHPHDGRQAVLPCDHRAMGHQAPDLRHQARDRDEQGRPAGVGVGGDQDVARFEIGLRHVQDDARPPFDGPGGNRQAHERARRHVLAPVRAGDDLAVRCEHPGRRERLIRPERLLALADELVIHVARAHDVLELLEPEVEDVLLLTKHVGLHEALGFFQQGLLVDEVAADHAVLRILPVPDEGPDPVDHPLGLFGLRHPRPARPAGAPAAPVPSAGPPAVPARSVARPRPARSS